jgi:hypothetical protein
MQVPRKRKSASKNVSKRTERGIMVYKRIDIGQDIHKRMAQEKADL